VPDITDTMLVRIGELEQQLNTLQSKVRELETELRGVWWARSNANAEDEQPEQPEHG
jgi:TolA-binding protein